MSVATATIKSKGKALKATYRLVGIDTNREVNRIPFAQLILVDGDAATRKFPLSDEAFFEPGSEVEIQLRHEGGKKPSATVFKGLAIRHALESDGAEAVLRIELRDAAYAMTVARRSAVHKGTDNAILKKLIQAAKAKAKISGATKPDHPEMVQYYCTDWDFMLSRAEAQNLVVAVHDGEVSLQPLKVSGSAKHKFEYGISPMYSFEMEADAGSQYAKVQSRAWDKKKNALSKASKGAAFALSQGNLKGDALAKKVGGKELLLTSAVPLDPAETKSWADGCLARSRMSLLRGSVTVPGFAGIKLLDVMEILGLGSRFKGKTLVTGIRHQVDEDGWRTHIQFGLPAEPFSQRPHILDAPAAGLLPAVHGLQPGIVEAFKQDPDKQFRIRIKLPGIDPAKGLVWARLAMPDAGKQRGHLFLPEKGDEVVVGFFNDDPRQAVILGSLYSSTNKPPKGWEKWTADNINKGFVSKTGITIGIDDKEQVLTLMTSEKQSIKLDEKKKTIEILDLNKNKITLSEKGVILEVADKLSIEAKGDIEVKGKNIKLEASDDVQVKGKNIKLEASADLAAKGKNINLEGSADMLAKGKNINLNASADVQAKGTNVKLNGSASVEIKGAKVDVK
ncbi:MAG: type VI secretion system tip protein VgrG [Phaeodactylibacter sp.]|nr:type VI secretion system tip protein VgrG [Phaeodactylibacter sp.]